MFPSRHQKRTSSPSRQSGSMLIIAVVVMTAILLLGLAMTRVLASSSNAVVYEVFGLRAFNAARAGLEANLVRVFNTSDVVPLIFCDDILDTDNDPNTNDANTINSSTLYPNFGSAAGFENCNFSSSCTVQSFNARGSTNGDVDNYFRFTSTAQCRAGEIIVSRTVAVDARI